MKKVFLFCFIIFSVLKVSALAEEQCPSLNLGFAGVIRGVYVGTEWGDLPWTKIKPNNDAEFTIMCGEEEMEKYFGKIGQVVTVTFDAFQFFNSENQHCYRNVICNHPNATHLSFPKK